MNRRSLNFFGSMTVALPSMALARTPTVDIPFRQSAEDALPAAGWYLLAFLAAALLVSLGFAWLRRRPAGARPGAALPAWLKRAGQTAGAIEVCDSARLDLRTSLFAVKWRDQELLLAAGESGVLVVATHRVHPAAPAAGSQV